MTPATPSPRSPINDGWIVFGRMLSDSFCKPASEVQDPVLAIATRRPGLFRRLREWLTRPSADTAGLGSSPSVDAVTGLDILVRGGLPR